MTYVGIQGELPNHWLECSCLDRHLRCAIRLRAQRSDYVALKQYILVRSVSFPQAIEHPLWVKSGHRSRSAQCPLYPQKRTSRDTLGMSALCHKQTSDRIAIIG